MNGAISLLTAEGLMSLGVVLELRRPDLLANLSPHLTSQCQAGICKDKTSVLRTS